MSDRRGFLEELVYKTVDHRRFTQESPVMPDVWIRYGMEPQKRQELLIVPNWHVTPSYLANELEAALERDSQSRFKAEPWREPTDHSSKPQVACNQNVVVASLWFDELIRVALPLSYWWGHSVAAPLKGKGTSLSSLAKSKTRFMKKLSDGMAEGPNQLPADVQWLVHVAGTLAAIVRGGLHTLEEMENALENGDPIKTIADLLAHISPPTKREHDPVYSVNLDREAAVSLTDSVPTVKADAAQSLFAVRGARIRWAVLDSGIDSTHTAFHEPRSGSRVKATYDFVNIRDLLSARPRDLDDEAKLADLTLKFPALGTAENRELMAQFLSDRARERKKGVLVDRVIDWDSIEPILRVTNSDDYSKSLHRHGTHVAGIIGANWREGKKTTLAGVAPEIQLYDLRVLDRQGRGREFSIMSALQFVRHLNKRKGFIEVHGVNLSFSIEHDVANYACGRTPVCDEASRLVASGVVVVAAAGNSGRARYSTPDGGYDDGFRTVSITDPGNAEAVITVGATHRRDAHTYGVSYFSSRGPTGDGRSKPDLVAPGEKIRSTLPKNGKGRLDGTSMAAPHVSGACALLLQRYSELIGQPSRVKEILCETATDLGRERHFQGAGLLDILRALQAV